MRVAFQQETSVAARVDQNPISTNMYEDLKKFKINESVVSKVNNLQESAQQRKNTNMILRSEMLFNQAEQKREGKILSFEHLSVAE
jgi:hypothetical protein